MSVSFRYTPSPAPSNDGADSVFYDGHCGLCHAWVHFVASRDRGGCAFRFAPLQGPTFESAVPPAVRASLPDSLVVQRADGSLLTRSAAVLHVLRRLGGASAVLAAAATLIPRPLRDLVYDGVARVRSRLFLHPIEACPPLPPELQSRFDP